MSNKRTRSRLAPEDRRAQILDVAAVHFAREGYEGTSMSKVAADAGVTRALVYHYFPGKEPLLGAVLQRQAGELLAATAPDPASSPRENLERAVGAYLDHFEGARDSHLVELYTPTAATPPLVWELVATNHEVQLTRLRDYLGLPDTERTGLALSSWLAFVEQAVREASGAPTVSRAEVLRLCFAALEVVTGLDLDSLDGSPR